MSCLTSQTSSRRSDLCPRDQQQTLVEPLLGRGLPLCSGWSLSAGRKAAAHPLTFSLPSSSPQVERPSFSIESLRRSTADSKIDGLLSKGEASSFRVHGADVCSSVSGRPGHAGSHFQRLVQIFSESGSEALLRRFWWRLKTKSVHTVSFQPAAFLLHHLLE